MKIYQIFLNILSFMLHIDGRQPKTRISKFCNCSGNEKKLIYSAMPHYIVLKLINYSNHML